MWSCDQIFLICCYSHSGHSSDSEDLPVTDTSSKLTPVKSPGVHRAPKLPRSPGTVTPGAPNGKEGEKDKQRDKSAFSSARTYKWTFQLGESHLCVSVRVSVPACVSVRVCKAVPSQRTLVDSAAFRALRIHLPFLLALV